MIDGAVVQRIRSQRFRWRLLALLTLLAVLTFGNGGGSDDRATASAAAELSAGRLVALSFPLGMSMAGSLVEVSPASGAYTTIAPVPSFALTSGIVALDPVAHQLYVQRIGTNPGEWSLWAFDTQTGVFTDAPLTQQLLALAYEASSDRLLGLTFPPGTGTSGSLVEVNPTTGVFTTIAPVPSFALTSGIVALDPVARRLYVQRIGANPGEWSLRAFDTQTGVFTDAPLTQQLLALAYEASSDRLVALTFPPGMNTDGSLVVLNPATGAFTTIAPVPSFALTSGIVALNPVARQLYVQRIGTNPGEWSLRAFDTQAGTFTDAPLTQQLLTLVYEAGSGTELNRSELYLPLVKR